MSELFQSAGHPDADQLGAFVEHALPAHEREQMLTHLALCSRCRTIVSLSMPPFQEAPKPEVVFPRKPWLYGWGLAWPAAAALAALILFAVHLHHAAITRNGIPNIVADANLPAPIQIPAAAPSPMIQPPKTPAHAARPQDHATHPVKADGAIDISSPQDTAGPTDRPIDRQDVADLPLNGRNVVDLPDSIPPRAQRSAMGAGGGRAGGGGAPPPVTLGAAVPDRLQLRAATAAAAAMPSIPQPSTSAAMNKPPQSAPAPPSPGADSALSESVTVAAAAPALEVEVTAAAPLSSMVSTQSRTQPLPSRLPVASTVSASSRILALDTAGSLFVSSDGGRQWKAVANPWRGRAVKLEMTSLPIGPVVQTANSYAAFDTIAVTGAASAPISTSAVTGIISDATGAVIRGASVAVTDTRTQVARKATTDANGRYLVDGLVPGAYQVEVQSPGFVTRQLAVTLASSQQVQASLTLAVGGTSQTVTVQAQAAAGTMQKRSTAATLAAGQSLPVFEITTDSGDHWTSSDGQSWKLK